MNSVLAYKRPGLTPSCHPPSLLFLLSTGTLLQHGSSLDMLVSRFAKLALAIATLFGQAVVANNRCDKPSVRREWRSMTRKQRIGWIDAVKVGWQFAIFSHN